VDVARLEKEYFERRPDVDDPNQLVSFGTSGHRGSPLRGTFNEAHILAITQAICEYRRRQGIDGPLYMGKDTHAVSGPSAAHRPRGAGGKQRGDDHSRKRTGSLRRRSSREPFWFTTAAARNISPTAS
jgi:hypothetical protein